MKSTRITSVALILCLLLICIGGGEVWAQQKHFGRKCIGVSNSTCAAGFALVDVSGASDGDTAHIPADPYYGGPLFYIYDEDSGAAESEPTVVDDDSVGGDQRWILQVNPLQAGGTGSSTGALTTSGTITAASYETSGGSPYLQCVSNGVTQIDAVGEMCMDSSTTPPTLVYNEVAGSFGTQRTVVNTDGTQTLTNKTLVFYEWFPSWRWHPTANDASAPHDPYTDVADANQADPTLYSTDTNSVEVQIKQFEELTSALETYWRVPDDFSGTSVKVRMHMIAVVGWDQTIELEIWGTCGTDLSDMGSLTMGTRQPIYDAPSSALVQDDVHIFPNDSGEATGGAASGTSWVTLTATNLTSLSSSADFCIIRLERDHDSANDAENVTVGFIGLDVKYQRTVGAF